MRPQAADGSAVAIRDCTLIAVEGTHASGKTTLAHALVAQYRERGFHAGTTGEAARTNPFIEDVVLRGHGAFDLAAEVDLFASQLSAELRSARSLAMLIADGTLANVLAYAGLLLAPTAGSREAAVLDALAHFLQSLGTHLRRRVPLPGPVRPAGWRG